MNQKENENYWNKSICYLTRIILCISSTDLLSNNPVSHSFKAFHVMWFHKLFQESSVERWYPFIGKEEHRETLQRRG